MRSTQQQLSALASLPGAGTMAEYLTGLGAEIRGILEEAGVLAEQLTSRWLAEQRFRPAPADLRGMLSTLRVASGDASGPGGCVRCAGRGHRATLIVGQTHEGNIERVPGVVYCDCRRGGWMHDEHQGTQYPGGPVKMLTASEFVAKARGARMVELGEANEDGEPVKGILWWGIADERGQGPAFEVPGYLARALTAQAQEVRQRRAGQVLAIERGEARREAPRRPEVGPRYEPPERQDRGWGQAAERFEDEGRWA